MTSRCKFNFEIASVYFEKIDNFDENVFELQVQNEIIDNKRFE